MAEGTSAARRLPLLTDEEASPEALVTFDAIRRASTTAVVEDLERALANAPELLGSVWDLAAGAFYGSRLPAVVKELIVYLVAVKLDCAYCRSEHAARATRLGISRDVLASISEGIEQSDLGTPLWAVLAFAGKFATAPAAISEQDFATLRRHGLTSEEISEAVAVATLAVTLTSLANALGLDADVVDASLEG